MSWMQRPRGVFDIDISQCSRCGGAMRALAIITDPRVIAATSSTSTPGLLVPRPSRHPQRPQHRVHVHRACLAPGSRLGIGPRSRTRAGVVSALAHPRGQTGPIAVGL
jgi:hypothetical protein